MNRRHLFGAGLVGAGSWAATQLADRFGLVPPDATGLWAPGHALTYASHRLLGANALAREFPRHQISAKPFANATPPEDPVYRQHQATGFSDWKLRVEGLVARPGAFTLAELRQEPAQSQITQLACEEGWSFIAEWTGVPLARLLERAGMSAGAKYVVYYSHQPGWWDSLDLADALHPQTLVTYGMNGQDLPGGHGGPLRMRVPRQLGYKSVKYLSRLVVTDSLQHFGQGKGSAAAEFGYAWYNGV